MTKKERLMKLNKVTTIKKPIQPTTIHISRFEFDLLEMTYADTTYLITEDDGTITTVKGEY